jgi:electron transport complex protein RnfG
MFSKLALLLGFFLLHSAQAKVFITVDEALQQSFAADKKCESKVENKYLTKSQSDQAKALSGYETASALVVRYALSCAGKLTAYAYTDTHRVRTHMETLFFLIDLTGHIEKIEVLSFDEPLDYIPKRPWYDTFDQVELSPSLQIKGKIPFVTGCSLTGQATVQASRRILAIDQVLRGKEIVP